MGLVMLNDPPLRVLFVSYVEGLCRLSEEQLRSFTTMEVRTATNVAEARSALVKEHFDAVVSGNDVPVDDGMHFLRSLRAEGNGIPFLFFRGRGNEDEIIAALKSGGDFLLREEGDSRTQFAELELRIADAVFRRNAITALERSNRELMDELRRSEEKFNMAFYGSASNMILARAHDGQIKDVNDPWLNIMGYTREEVVGNSMSGLLVWKHPEQRDEWIRELRRSGKVFGREYEFNGKDGRDIVVLMSGQMITFDGEVLVLTSGIDISDRKRAEQALCRANTKLGVLNSITRHDMINQIAALSGYLELIKRREKDPAQVQYLDKMSRAVDNLQKQIAFTKDYQDMGVKAPIWVSVGQQTVDAFDMLAPEGVVLEETTAGLEVLADQLAEKAPYNLIDNSIRHGGHVKSIKMSAKQIGEAMLIVYQDDGVGIEAQDREHIFEKGFGKNSGLGLYLVREILAITGITIEETGRPGQGVRFEMKVPAGAWRRTSCH